MNPTHAMIRTAIGFATGANEDGIAFTYPLHRSVIRRDGHRFLRGWTTGVTIPSCFAAPNPGDVALALGRPAGTIEVDAVGSLLFLTIFDQAA